MAFAPSHWSGEGRDILKQLLAERPGIRLRELVDGFVKGRISVIMPAYNEADCICKNIANVKSRFEAICDDVEVIVVDDGSGDGTRKLVANMTGDAIKLVSYDRNEGKGFALRKGFVQVTGEFTFLVDSDAEIMAKELTAYLEALKVADIAIGSKRHPLSSVRTPVLRRFLSLGFNVLERLLTGVKATDTQAGFKGIRSRALYTILPLITAKRYAFDLELLAVASILDLKVTELPVDIDLKALVDLNRVSRMMIDTLGIAYRLRILRWYQKNIINMSNTYYPMIRW